MKILCFALSKLEQCMEFCNLDFKQMTTSKEEKECLRSELKRLSLLP